MAEERNACDFVRQSVRELEMITYHKNVCKKGCVNTFSGH